MSKVLHKRAVFTLFFIFFSFTLACTSSDETVKDSAEVGKTSSRNKVETSNPQSHGSVQIRPLNPSVNSTLRINPPAGNSENPEESAQYRFQWYVNGEPLPNEIQTSLGPGNFSRGDKVFCEITSSNVQGKTLTSKTKEVIIVNSPPEIIKIDHEPSVPTRQTGITLSVETEDADEDFIEVSYKWNFHGKEIPEETDNQLPGKHLKKGYKIWATVTADDGLTTKEQKTDEWIIGNSVPTIDSIPPEYSGQASTYTYQVQANDIDGDKLKYEATGVSNLTISPTGLLKWTPSKEDAGQKIIEIRVSDESGDRAIQKIEMFVNLITPTPTAKNQES